VALGALKLGPHSEVFVKLCATSPVRTAFEQMGQGQRAKQMCLVVGRLPGSYFAG
jgi:hypothetical protein